MLWQNRASCKGDYDYFTAEHTSTAIVETLKKICGRCPVQVECLEYALKNKEPVGMWGGLTTAERKSGQSRRKNIINLDPEALRKDFETMTLAAVTAKYKVSQQVIYRHLKEFPWIRPKKGKRQ